MSARLSAEDRRLLQAAQYNDLKQVRKSISLGANVNACEEDLIKPLHIAVEQGFTELVEILLSIRGTRIDDKTLFGSTPLGKAATLQDVKILKMLLKAGANPNKKQLFSRTPLHLAIMENKLECAKELLKYGANVNLPDCFDQTPLYLSAIINPDPTMARLLLYSGADLNFKYKCEMPILSLIITQAKNPKHIRLTSFLLKNGANANELENIKNETPLHKAVFTGSIPIIRLLVQHGANMGARNIFGKTPLELAIMHKNYQAANELKMLTEKEEEEEIRKLFRKYSKR